MMGLAHEVVVLVIEGRVEEEALVLELEVLVLLADSALAQGQELLALGESADRDGPFLECDWHLKALPDEGLVNLRLGEGDDARNPSRRDFPARIRHSRREIVDLQMRRASHLRSLQGELTFRPVGAPWPPPPGVSIRRASPARSLPAALLGSGSPLRRLRPVAPSPPPLRPRGGWRRRSVISVYRIGASASTSRTVPSPPWWRPTPSLPRRSESSRTRNGNSASNASTGVLSVFDIATWIALGPSASGQAPWPPPSVS